MIKETKIYYLLIILTSFTTLLKAKNYDLVGAIQGGRSKVERLLKQIKENKDIDNPADYQDKNGNTLLMYAVYFNQFDIAKFLIEEKNANVNIHNDETTALIVALVINPDKEKIDMKIIDLFINNSKTDPNIIQKTGDGPLKLAVENIQNKNDREKTIKILIEKRKANVNKQLFLLAKNKQFNSIKILLGYDIILNQFNPMTKLDNSETFLDYITTIEKVHNQQEKYMMIEVLDLLLNVKKIHLPDILMKAMKNQNNEILNWLITNIQINWDNFATKEVSDLFQYCIQYQLFDLAGELLIKPELQGKINISPTSQKEEKGKRFRKAILRAAQKSGNSSENRKNFSKTLKLLQTKKLIQWEYWDKKDTNELFKQVAIDGSLELFKLLFKNQYLKDNFNIEAPSTKKAKNKKLLNVNSNNSFNYTSMSFLESLMDWALVLEDEVEEIAKKKLAILQFLIQEKKIVPNEPLFRKAILLAVKEELSLIVETFDKDYSIEWKNWNKKEIRELFNNLDSYKQNGLKSRLTKKHQYLKNQFELLTIEKNKKKQSRLKNIKGNTQGTLIGINDHNNLQNPNGGVNSNAFSNNIQNTHELNQGGSISNKTPEPEGSSIEDQASTDTQLNDTTSTRQKNEQEENNMSNKIKYTIIAIVLAAITTIAIGIPYWYLTKYRKKQTN